jgi:hypothetical protein
MTVLKRVMMGMGGIATLAALLQVAAPKAVHAITATMVQVTNTASVPAITENVPNLASQIVTLTANISISGGFETGGYFYQVSPLGDQSGTIFLVPEGQSFVVNAIDFEPISPSTHAYLALVNPNTNGGFYEVWKPRPDAESEYQYPSGIVLGSGAAPFIGPVATTQGKVSAEFNVYIHGYLTAN